MIPDWLFYGAIVLGCYWILLIVSWAKRTWATPRVTTRETLRMVDQERPASIVKLASFNGKATKGFSDARKVDRVAGVIDPKGKKAS